MSFTARAVDFNWFLSRALLWQIWLWRLCPTEVGLAANDFHFVLRHPVLKRGSCNTRCACLLAAIEKPPVDQPVHRLWVAVRVV